MHLRRHQHVGAPMYHPMRRCYVQRVNSFAGDALIAVTSKVVANTICYPVESVRMWTISRTRISPSLTNLFQGYNIYFPYTLVNNCITFSLFYACNYLFGTRLGLPVEQMLIATSVLTSCITTLYKVPVSYALKRTVIQQDICMKTIQDLSYFMNAYRAVLIEDIPELFIKFYLRSYLGIHYESMPSVYKSMIIGVVSTALLTPIELYKTRVICHNVAIHPEKMGFVLRIFISVANTFIFFFLLDILKAWKF